jgi:phosphocarrier protein HPr
MARTEITMLQNQKIKDLFVVLNEKGLHTRPATELVKCVSNYKAQVTLHYQNLSVNAKSLLGILMLAAARGAKIKIEAEGEDAETCVRALVDLAKRKFHMNY